MHSITRKLFLYHLVLLAAGCRSPRAEAKAKVVVAKGSVPLSNIARLYTMKISQPSSSRVRMANKWNTIEIETNSRRAWINGTMFWLQHPCRKSGSEWTINAMDFNLGIDSILRAYAHVSKVKVPKIIVLDPGHGGKDSGAVGPSKVYEKDVVLDISKRVQKLLADRKLDVRLTRTGDTFPSLEQRSEYAAKVSADLFVSIHADAAGDASAQGVETFISSNVGGEASNHYGQGTDTDAVKNNAYDAANAILGFALQSNHVKASKRSDRGLRRARYAVLKNGPCPAALVECGFLSNPAEETLLNSVSFRENVARGIANGILSYITIIKKSK